MSYGKRRRVGMRRRVEVNTEVLPAVPTTEQLPLSACGAVEVSDIVTKPITSVSDSHINCAGVKKSDNDDCVICLEDLSKADYTGLLPKCSHVFCFECISHWSKQETSCPLCKVEFTTITKALGAKAAESVKLTNGKKRKAATELRTKSVKVKKTSQAEYVICFAIITPILVFVFLNLMASTLLTSFSFSFFCD